MINSMKSIFDELNWRNFLALTVAGCINAFGVTVFLAPVRLYDSGISGTSMVFSQLTPDYLSLSVFLIVLNFPLFIYGLKKQGKTFTVYSLYAVLIYSIGAWMITDKPDDVSQALIEEFECGTTKIAAKGGYSNTDKTVIYFVVNRFQITRMKNIIRRIDSNAYVTISEVADVLKGLK